MADLSEIFKYAKVETVEGRKYYDIGQRSFDQLKDLAAQDPALQKAIDESLMIGRQSGNWYLVPVDLIGSGG